LKGVDMKTLANRFLVKLNLMSPSTSCLPNAILALDLKLLSLPLKDLTVSFSHAGNLKSLQSNVNVKYGTHKPVLLSIDMVNAKKLKSTFKLTLHFFAIDKT
jgi:hypothetical protein